MSGQHHLELRIISDYERAAIKTARRAFPRINIEGCAFLMRAHGIRKGIRSVSENLCEVGSVAGKLNSGGKRYRVPFAFPRYQPSVEFQYRVITQPMNHVALLLHLFKKHSCAARLLESGSSEI